MMDKDNIFIIRDALKLLRTTNFDVATGIPAQRRVGKLLNIMLFNWRTEFKTSLQYLDANMPTIAKLSENAIPLPGKMLYDYQVHSARRALTKRYRRRLAVIRKALDIWSMSRQIDNMIKSSGGDISLGKYGFRKFNPDEIRRFLALHSCIFDAGTNSHDTTIHFYIWHDASVYGDGAVVMLPLYNRMDIKVPENEFLGLEPICYSYGSGNR